MKNTFVRFFYMLGLSIVLSSCLSVRKMTPVVEEDGVILNSEGYIETNEEPYIFKVGDEIMVKILSEDPNMAKYLGTEFVDNGSQQQSSTSKPNFSSRTIDEDGYISIPRLGKIYIQGKTKEQARTAIRESLRQLYKGDVTVKVDLANYVYLQMGDSGWKKVVSDKKLNLFEYFAENGGFANTSKLSHIKIYKKMENGYKPVVVNFNKMSIISQKEFYLDNNDVIIIDPVKFKSIQVGTGSFVQTLSTLTGFIFSMLGSYYLIKNL